MRRRLSIFLTALLIPSFAHAAALPQLDWLGQGRVDWRAGYLIGYGAGRAGNNLADRNQLRLEGLKRAFGEATRNLYRLALDLRVQHSMTLRDYFQVDPELQENFRRWLQGLAPWEASLGAGDEVRVAVKLPLGGGGLMDFLEEKGLEFDGGEGLPAAGPLLPPSQEKVEMSGVILIADASGVFPALRPRIRSREGAVLLDHGTAGESVRARPAFLSYYGSVEEALVDPLLGDDPLVALTEASPGSGTDIVLPPVLEESLLATPEGMSLLREGRIVIVLRP